MDGLGREHQVGVVLEARVDVVGVAVARNDAGDDALEKTDRLPRRRTALRVADQALLSHDWNGIARGAANGVEDVVPEVSLVLLIGVGARAVNGQNADIVSLETPDCESAVQRRDTRVESLKHAVGSERVLLLLSSLEFHVGDTRGEVFLVGRIALALGELHVLLELRLLVSEPLADLLATEGKLARAVREIQTRKRALGRNRAGNREGTGSGRRDGTASLVAV